MDIPLDVSFLGGPPLQRGVGVVAPFDFALDRELWRWVPDDVSLHLTRTPFVPVEVSLSMARLISEHTTLRDGVQALMAIRPEVVAYACTSGSFVGGTTGEQAMCHAMQEAGAPAAVTTSGALLEALRVRGAARIAVITPYTRSVTDSLESFLGEGGVRVVAREYLGLTREIWRVSYRDVVEMARRTLARPDAGPIDALFISCTNLATYDAIPQLEAELRVPVLAANQVTVWSALRRIGKGAVGPYQSLLMEREPVTLTDVLPDAVPAVPPAADPLAGAVSAVLPPVLPEAPEAPAEPVADALPDALPGALPDTLPGPPAEPLREPRSEVLSSDTRRVNNPQGGPYGGTE